MTIKELVAAIEQKHKSTGVQIHAPASIEQIREFERRVGFQLPLDFEDFYLTCNGFACNEDMFNMVPLEDIYERGDYSTGGFDFAEYLIYSDTWVLRILEDAGYEIYNVMASKEVILTSSLQEFLMRFYTGGVFEKAGLYDWAEEDRSL
jgi:hypothetical protein